MSSKKKMQEAFKIMEEFQPRAAAEYYEILLQKSLKEGYRNGYREGLLESYREGLQEDQQKSMEQVAERMIGKDMTDTDIHVFTQLSLEQISKLRRNTP